MLFRYFKDKSEIMACKENILLSQNTVMCRTEEINQNFEDILYENIN